VTASNDLYCCRTTEVALQINRVNVTINAINDYLRLNILIAIKYFNRKKFKTI